MASIKVTVATAVNGERLGNTPFTRRLEAPQLSLQDIEVDPSSGAIAFLPANVDVKKVWSVRTDKAVRFLVSGQVAFSLNPGGFVVICDGALGALLIENQDTVETVVIEQLCAGADA